MDDLTILDNLKPGSFQKEDTDEIKIEGAIFLTYSIDCKSILSALISMFANDIAQSGREDKLEGDKKDNNIVRRWEYLMHHGMSPEQPKTPAQALIELQEHIAFVCNDGYDKSIASPIYWYTRELTYYYKPAEEENKHSFHPKLYIVKYTKNGEIFFRFMIGSMNFVNSKNKEFMVIFDVQAYKENSSDEYVSCSIITELLNLIKTEEGYISKNIKNEQKTKLSKVVENLALDKLFFRKDVMSGILTFPLSEKDNEGTNKIKNDIKKSNIILSPFLTQSMIKKQSNVRLYTMESELRKHGYIPVKDGEEIAEEEKNVFYVYTVEEGEKAFTHIKMYVSEEENRVYVGSANYTKSAFEKNKEILIRLDIDKVFKEELESYLEKNYECKTYKYSKKEIPQPKLNDIFREIAEELSNTLEQRIYVEKNERKSSVSTKIGKKINIEDKINRLKESIEREDMICNPKIEIRIAPFLCGEERVIDELEKRKSLDWQINNRVKWDDNFIFSLYVNGKKKVQFQYHLKTTYDGQIKQEEDSQTIINMTIFRLSELLADKGVSSKTITKNMDQIESGNIRKDSVAFIRRSLPTLEDILKKNMEKDKLTGDVVQNHIMRIEQIKSLLNDTSLTEEEKKFLGFDYSNKKIMNNFLTQSELLLREL